MSRHVLYAYADGPDLLERVDRLHQAIEGLIAVRRWDQARPQQVNQLHQLAPREGPLDLPQWEVGVLLLLPQHDRDPSGWFDDVAAIVAFLESLAQREDIGFVFGVRDDETGLAADIVRVTGPGSDLDAVHAAIDLLR